MIFCLAPLYCISTEVQKNKVLRWNIYIIVRNIFEAQMFTLKKDWILQTSNVQKPQKAYSKVIQHGRRLFSNSLLNRECHFSDSKYEKYFIKASYLFQYYMVLWNNNKQCTGNTQWILPQDYLGRGQKNVLWVVFSSCQLCQTCTVCRVRLCALVVSKQLDKNVFVIFHLSIYYKLVI